MAFHRRKFLERLSLGAGMFALAPMVNSLLSEAHGAVVGRTRFVVFTFSNGGFWENGLPPEIKSAKQEFGTDLLQTSQFTLPYMYEPLAPYRDRMLLVDGLVNQQLNFGHFSLDLLTCCPKTKASGDHYGNPGGRSFDQHVADVIGGDTAFRSFHLGATTQGSGEATDAKLTTPGIVAKGAGEGIPVQMSPADAFAALFPTGAAKPMEGPDPAQLERRKLLDYLADDIKRVRANLANPERQKLDEYLSSVENAQKRLDTLHMPPPGCGEGGPAVTQADVAEKVFPAQIDVAAAALTCGMSNVVTIGFHGIGKAFRSLFPDSEDDRGIDLHSVGHGHGNDASPPHGPRMINWWSSELARLIKALSSVTEGDGTIFDKTVILFASENAESHHSRCWRYPVVLLGGAQTGLKADGRYIRYPTRTKGDEKPNSGPAGMRCIGDLMSTLGHAVGAPVDDWGKNGLEEGHGPLSELLV